MSAELDDLLFIQDEIDRLEHLAMAMFMACQGVRPGEQRSALSELAETVRRGLEELSQRLEAVRTGGSPS